MKKQVLFSLFSLIIFSFIYNGCSLLLDDEMEGPVPYDSQMGDTLAGTYIVDNFTVTPGNTKVDIPVLNGGFAVDVSVSDASTDESSSEDLDESDSESVATLEYRYKLAYGYLYSNDTESATTLTEAESSLLGDYSEDDNFLILDQPIEITDGDRIYQIYSLRKTGSTSIEDIEEADIEKDFFDSETIKLCDPLGIAGDICTDINGAISYIGNYLVTELTCDGELYSGGDEFVGEMAATALFQGTNVSVPITLKLQFASNDLVACMFGSEENDDYFDSENNLYFEEISYLVSIGNDFSLADIFVSMGLESISSVSDSGYASDEIRTTEINYYPKLVADSGVAGDDRTFNGNSVSMRLKILNQGGLGERISKTITKEPLYFTTDSGNE